LNELPLMAENGALFVLKIGDTIATKAARLAAGQGNKRRCRAALSLQEVSF